MNEIAQQAIVPDTFHGMFIGYTVIWLAIAGYVLRLGRLIANLEKH